MQKEEFLIIKAEEIDIPELSLFSCQTFTDSFKDTCTEEDLDFFLKETYSPETLKREFNQENSEVWLFKMDNQIAGYLKLNYQAPLPYPKSGLGMEIQRIYIGKPFQSLGFGKKLMIHAFKKAMENHETTLWLGVWEYNERAKKFYENLGFEYFGSHPFPIGKTPQVDLWMMKKLQP